MTTFKTFDFCLSKDYKSILSIIPSQIGNDKNNLFNANMYSVANLVQEFITVKDQFICFSQMFDNMQ